MNTKIRYAGTDRCSACIRLFSFIINIMILKLLQQKKLLRIGMLLPALAIAALLLPALQAPPNTPAGMIGPYKLSALILSGTVLLFFFDLYRNKANSEILTAWGFFLIGTLWGLIIYLYHYVSPDTAAFRSAEKWSFIGIIFLFSAIALRIRVRLRNTKINLFLSQKTLLFLTLLFIFLSLFPILKSGFYWDDAFFSAQNAAIRVRGESILQKVWDEAIHYSSSGRINPFATFQFLMFYIFPGPVAYKSAILLLTLLDCFLFYIFMKKLTTDEHIPLLILLIVSICIQFRIYHDPMLAYYGLMQIMFAELILALIFFLKFMETGRERYRIFSLIFFTIGLLSYEMAYPLILLFPLLSLFRRKRLVPCIRDCLPFGIIGIALLAASFTLRASSAGAAQTYTGTTFSLLPDQFFTAWRYQTLAAFPFSYRLADTGALIGKQWFKEHAIFDNSWTAFLTGIRWIDLFGLAAAGLVLQQISSIAEKKAPRIRIKAEYGIFALALLLLSGVIIALSEKYQHQLLLGIGYLPVYYEYFAAAILIFLGLWLLYRLLRRFAAKGAILSIFFAAFAVLYLYNNQTNRHVVTLLNEWFLYPRRTGEAALQSGILRDFNPATSILVSNNPNAFWERSWEQEPRQEDFYTANHGVTAPPLIPLGVSEFASLVTAGEPDFELFSPGSTYVIEYSGTEHTGLAKYGKIFGTGFSPDRTILRGPVVREVLFFVYGDQAMPDTLTWKTWNGTGHEIKLTDAWLIRETAQGRLYKLDFQETIQFDTIGLTGYQ